LLAALVVLVEGRLLLVLAAVVVLVEAWLLSRLSGQGDCGTLHVHVHGAAFKNDFPLSRL